MKTRTIIPAKASEKPPQKAIQTTLARHSISQGLSQFQVKTNSSAGDNNNSSFHTLDRISPFRPHARQIITSGHIDSKALFARLETNNFSQSIVQPRSNSFISTIDSISSSSNLKIQRNWFKKTAKKVGKSLSKGFDWVKEKIVKPIKRAAQRLLNSLKKQGRNFVNRLKSAAKRLLGKAKRAVLNFIRKIKQAVKKLILKAKRLASRVIEKAQRYAQKVAKKVGKIARKILSYASKMAKKYAQKMMKLTQYFLKIGNPQKAQKLIQNLSKFAGKVVDWATKKIMGLVRRATAIVTKVMQNATRKLSRLIQWTAGGVQRLVKQAISVAKRLINGAIKGVENFIRQAGNISKLFNKVKSKLNRILGPARGKANWLIDQMMRSANDMMRNFLRPLAKQAGAWMRRLTRPAMKFVSKILNKATAGITRGIKAATNKLTKSMQWLIASIKRLLELYIEKVLKNKLQIGATIVKRIVDGVIKAIEKIILEPLKAFFEFMNLITQILAKAGGVLDKILGHPVRFIKNLFSGVKGGLSTFVGRMGIHLERGLQSFLFGPIAETGIEMPKTLDSSGLLTVVGQLSGLSYDRIRERAAGKLGEEKVAFLEGGASAIQSGNVGEFAQEQAQGYADNQMAAVKEKAGPLGRMGDIFQVLKKGPGGLIKYFQELDFNSLIMGIMGEIKEYLIQEIVQKAVIQVVSYLTPGAGWLKAAIDALRVMYALFIERAQQVKDILDGFTDSVVSIAKQAIAPAIKRLDGALGKSIPVLIGVLADYLGIGGIPQKIQSFLKKGQKWVDTNVMPIIDKILDKVAAAFAKLPSMNVADYIPKGMGAGNFYAPLRKQLGKVTKKPFKNLDKARTAVNFIGTAFKPMGLKSLNLEPANSQGKTFNVIAMKPLPGRQLSPVVGQVNTVNNNSFKRVARRNSNSLSLSPKTNAISRNSISAIQRSPVSLRIQPANSSAVQPKPNVSSFIKNKSPLVSTISRSQILQRVKNNSGNQGVGTIEISNTNGKLSEADRKYIQQIEREVAKINEELALELTKLALDIAGIIDPTPTADSLSAAISVKQEDYLGASLSLLSWIPYLGDAVAKPIKATRSWKKLQKILSRIKSLIAKHGGRLKQLKGAAVEKLVNSLNGLKNRIDNSLQKLKKSPGGQRNLDKILKGLSGTAKTKYKQILDDSSIPKDVKESFFSELNQTLEKTREDINSHLVYQAMKDIVSKNPNFLAKGLKIPLKELQSKGGMTRIVPLKTMWNDNLSSDYKKNFESFNDWLDAIRENPDIFNPNKHLQKGSTIPGEYATAWWSPRSEQQGNTMAELIKELSLKSETYSGGGVRVTVSPEVSKIGVGEFRKPTALDGIFFEEFKPAPNSIWGITAGGSLEAVAPQIPLSGASKIEFLPN